MKTFKIAVYYGDSSSVGDSGIGGSVKAEEYSNKVKWELLGFVNNLFSKPGFSWCITNDEGEVMDSFNG